MEDVSNVSSEEELLRLRNEGKISEQEYNELLGSMKVPPRPDNERVAEGGDKRGLSRWSKERLGKTALCLMLLAFIIPAVGFAIASALRPAASPEGPQPIMTLGCFIYVGLILAIAAFALGIAGWPNVYAKVTLGAFLFILLICVFFVRGAG